MSLLVRGGPANSGRKRALKEKGKDWKCACGPQRYYIGYCKKCDRARP